MRSPAPLLSVVVPVGPDDDIAPALRSQLQQLPPACEVIEVRARSARPGAVVSGAFGATPAWRLLHAPAGRACQQNHGAAAASGACVWFVHADSRFAAGTVAAALDFARSSAQALAYFDLRFVDDGPRWMWLNTVGAALRSRWLQLPFGDQGLLLRRADFMTLTGFRQDLAGGEDHDLVWRARRAGLPLRPLRQPLFTSARKYAAGGWARTTFAHLRATAAQARRFARPGDAANTADRARDRADA